MGGIASLRAAVGMLFAMSVPLHARACSCCSPLPTVCLWAPVACPNCSTHAARGQRIPEAAVWTYLLQAARGLQHLHRWDGRRVLGGWARLLLPLLHLLLPPLPRCCRRC